MYNGFHVTVCSNHLHCLELGVGRELVQHCLVAQEPKLCCDQACGTEQHNIELQDFFLVLMVKVCNSVGINPEPPTFMS